MDQRIYHGNLAPVDFAREIISHFNRGNYRVQQIGNDTPIAVQIATIGQPASGGQTALSISLQKVTDGVAISIGQQEWLGVAASLGKTAIAALRNPFSLISRLDDLAQDIESLQLTEEVWNVITQSAKAAGAGHELSERLRRTVCGYCGSANPVGQSNCVACGAPLGDVQPETCPACGFVLTHEEKFCPNCGRQV